MAYLGRPSEIALFAQGLEIAELSERKLHKQKLCEPHPTARSDYGLGEKKPSRMGGFWLLFRLQEQFSGQPII